MWLALKGCLLPLTRVLGRLLHDPFARLAPLPRLVDSLFGAAEEVDGFLGSEGGYLAGLVQLSVAVVVLQYHADRDLVHFRLA